MKKKYVEEKFPFYEFLEVGCITDGTNVFKADADDVYTLIKQNNRAINFIFLLSNILERLDDELLKKLWYSLSDREIENKIIEIQNTKVTKLQTLKQLKIILNTTKNYS